MPIGPPLTRRNLWSNWCVPVERFCIHTLSAAGRSEGNDMTATWRARMDLTAIVALSALGLSGLSFYRSHIYTKQQLDVTVTEVSYVTNQGELYMTVAFSNGGNRDAAPLRVEPALWGHRSKPDSEWIPSGWPTEQARFGGRASTRDVSKGVLRVIALAL